MHVTVCTCYVRARNVGDSKMSAYAMEMYNVNDNSKRMRTGIVSSTLCDEK